MITIFIVILINANIWSLNNMDLHSHANSFYDISFGKERVFGKYHSTLQQSYVVVMLECESYVRMSKL